MTDDLLNQDDIDALMRSYSSDSPPGPALTQTAIVPESLKIPSERWCLQASTVLATVLNKSCEVQSMQMVATTESTLWEKTPQLAENALSVKISCTQGVEGSLYVLLTKTNTALLADLMMMGDGTAPFENDHKDALGELTNQIMGAFNSALGTELGTTFASSQAIVQDFSAYELPFSLNGAVQTQVQVKILEQTPFDILIIWEDALVQSFSQYYGTPDDSPGVPQTKTKQAGQAPSGNQQWEEELEEVPTQTPVLKKSSNPNIDMLLDIPLDVTIELGRSEMSIRKVLELGPGAIVELDRKASEPVDLLVNDKVVARGEVVVVDEFFGIRIVSLLTPEERLRQLR